MKFMSTMISLAVIFCYLGYSQSFYIRPQKSHFLHHIRSTPQVQISKVLPKVVKRELILLSLWTKVGISKVTQEDFNRAHFLLSHHAPMDQVVGLFIDDPVQRAPVVARMRVAARVLLRKALMAQRLKIFRSMKAAQAAQPEEEEEEEEEVTSASGSGDFEKQIDNTMNTPVDDEDHLNTETDVVAEEPLKIEDQSGEEITTSAQGSGFDDNGLEEEDEEQEEAEEITTLNSDSDTTEEETTADDRAVENSGNENSGFSDDADDDDDNEVEESGEEDNGRTSDTSSPWLDDEDFAEKSESSLGGETEGSAKLENSGDSLGVGSGSIAEEYSGQDLYEIITVHRIEKPVITPPPDKKNWPFGDSNSAEKKPVEISPENEFDTAADKEETPRIVEPTVIKPSEELDLDEDYFQPKVEEENFADADFDLNVIPEVRAVYTSDHLPSTRQEDYVSDIF